MLAQSPLPGALIRGIMQVNPPTAGGRVYGYLEFASLINTRHPLILQLGGLLLGQKVPI